MQPLAGTDPNSKTTLSMGFRVKEDEKRSTNEIIHRMQAGAVFFPTACIFNFDEAPRPGGCFTGGSYGFSMTSPVTASTYTVRVLSPWNAYWGCSSAGSVGQQRVT